MPKLHLLTLTWNGEDKLKSLHKSLIPTLKGIDYQWVIKDNGSKDNTVKMVESWNNPNIKLIAYPNNLHNFSEGMNYCFKEANANDDDFIMLLNNDVVFNDTTSIKNMISLMRDNTGAVGARLLYSGTNKLQHAGVTFSPKHKGPFHFRSGEESDKNSKMNRKFQVVTGAILLTTAGIFKQVRTDNPSGISGMDENFRWAFDDVDMCLSIKYNLGKDIVYCGSTNIFHEESASLKKNPVNKMFMGHNWNYLQSKWSKRIELDSELYQKDPNYNTL